MKKKLLALFTALLLTVVFCSCEKANVTSEVVITSEAGAGTRTIVFSFPEDKKTEIETDANGGMNYHIYNNETYFPKGVEAFANFIAERLPKEGGYTFETRLSATSEIEIAVSYSFANFDEYAKKTKLLMGAERWEKASFATPQVFVTRVNDPADADFGKLRVTYAESHYFTAACVAGIMEVGFCQEAVDAGLLLPYGDSFDNPDCRQMFIDYKPSEKTFEAFADVYYLTGADRACEETVKERRYTYLDQTFTTVRGDEGLVSFCVLDDGTKTLTDPTPWLGGKEGELYVDAEGVWALTLKEGVEDDGVWSLDDFDKTKVVLGKKAPSAAEATLTAPKKAKSPLVWIIVGALAAAVAAAVIVVVIKKRSAEEEDDEDDEEDATPSN